LRAYLYIRAYYLLPAGNATKTILWLPLFPYYFFPFFLSLEDALTTCYQLAAPPKPYCGCPFFLNHFFFFLSFFGRHAYHLPPAGSATKTILWLPLFPYHFFFFLSFFLSFLWKEGK
jgi:hypothetical protein